MKSLLGKTSARKPGRISLAVALAALLGATIGVQNAGAATLLVTSTADDGSPSTLRALLAAAVDGDTIDATGITGTIVLTGSYGSDLMVNKSVTILGPGPSNLTVDGNHETRVFQITTGHTVTIDGITIANGGGGNGGGILNVASKLTVRNCVFSGNTGLNGGGIANFGGAFDASEVSISNSRFEGNTAFVGGAIGNLGFDGIATTTVTGCTFSGNSAKAYGGAIAFGGALANQSSGADSSQATLIVTGCTLNGNTAIEGGGGGIQNDASEGGNALVSVASTTLSGNSAGQWGSGLYNQGRNGEIGSAVAQIFGCTLSGNVAEFGTIFNSYGTLELGNTILKVIPVGSDIVNNNGAGEIISLGFNLSSGTANGGAGFEPGGWLNATGDQRNTDPKLGPLADNGGPTLTHLPLADSPVIDKGSSDVLTIAGVSSDQRGLARTVDDPSIANAPFGDGTDIGAVEVAAAPPPPPPAPVADVAVSFLGADKDSVKQGEVLTYTIAVRNFGPDAAPNVVLTNLLSSGTGFLSARATKGSFSAPPVNETGTVVWTLGDMANGAAGGAELVVSVLVKGKTTVTILATISSDAEDPDAGNNIASVTTAVATGGSGGGKGGKK